MVSVHLDARDWGAKQKQIKQLVQHLGAKDDSVEQLVMGDYNVCPQHIYDDGSQWSFLTKQMEGIGLEDLWSGDQCEPTEGQGTLDHIFWRPLGRTVISKRVVRVTEPHSGLSVSDHYGIEAIV